MPNDIGDLLQNVSSPHGWNYDRCHADNMTIRIFRTMWLLQSIITMPIGAANLSLQRYGMFFRKALILSCFCVCCVIFVFVGKLSPVIFRALRTQRKTPAQRRGYCLYKINSLAQGFCDGGQGVETYTITAFFNSGDVVAKYAASLA